MKLIRCNNGHFYDQDKFSSCPYCNGGNSTSDSMTEAFEDQVTMPLREPQPPMGSGAASVGTQPAQPEAAVSKSLEQALNQAAPAAPMSGINSVFAESPAGEDYTVAITPGGKTMWTEGQKPAVGWLVCIKGKHIGKDYRLVQGKNYIGRDASMDVCLKGEKTVSRDRHAVIVYDPMNHLYLIQSGESKELTYVNDKVILESQELSSSDKILVGDVKLLFVPLCSEEFNWTDVLEGKEEEKIDDK